MGIDIYYSGKFVYRESALPFVRYYVARSIDVRLKSVQPGPTLARFRPSIDLVPLYQLSRLAYLISIYALVDPMVPNRSNVAEQMSETLK